MANTAVSELDWLLNEMVKDVARGGGAVALVAGGGRGGAGGGARAGGGRAPPLRRRAGAPDAGRDGPRVPVRDRGRARCVPRAAGRGDRGRRDGPRRS